MSTLIACPNPTCAHEVVHNWPSCPKCHCPIQVLLAAQAAKAQEAALAEGEEARLEEEKPSGRMLERLKAQAREEGDEDHVVPEAAELDVPSPRSPRGDLVAKAGVAMAGLGGVALVGVPLTLDQAGMTTFLGLAALVFFGAGYGLHQVADNMTQRS